jgi:hypothetical protein
MNRGTVHSYLGWFREVALAQQATSQEIARKELIKVQRDEDVEN